MTAIQALTAEHDCRDFNCGSETLDTFLRLHALKNQENDSSRTFVVCEGGIVVGYYTLTYYSLIPEKCPAPMVLRMPPDYQIPMILLGRLAVKKGLQGKGIGDALFKDALKRAVLASEHAGLKAFLVHAVDEKAKAFYMRYELEESPKDPLHLYMLIQDIRVNFNL